MSHYLLIIDQGTTNPCAIIFSTQGLSVASCQQEFRQYFPKDDWVEHDDEETWLTALQVCHDALTREGLRAADIAAISIINQHETTLVWDAASGNLIHPAIVQRDRHTADYCAEFKAASHETNVSTRTGLLIDPYSSATKLHWVLDNVPSTRQRTERDGLRFGTVGCFLLWRLTGGRPHRTNATNTSRILLSNVHGQDWDRELLALFEIPRSLPPEVLDCAVEFDVSELPLFGAAILVLGMADDQQAALVGQACFQPGMVESTYDTDCFTIQNTSEQPVTSENRLLTTVGYRLDGRVSYAVEDSISVAGIAVRQLRDGIELIDRARESEALAVQAGDSDGIYLVPAFTGLGAPYWDPKTRGAIFDLTRGTGIKEIVTAGLQSVCYQTRDLLEAMCQDSTPPNALRVDGGVVVNNWVVQFLTDILGATVERSEVTETTALGVAYMIGLEADFYHDLDDIASHWHLQRRFAAHMAEERHDELYAGWQNAVRRVRSEA